MQQQTCAQGNPWGRLDCSCHRPRNYKKLGEAWNRACLVPSRGLLILDLCFWPLGVRDDQFLLIPLGGSVWLRKP